MDRFLTPKVRQIRLNFDFQSRGETETTEGVRIHIYIYVYLSIVMHRRAGYATVAVSRKERGWRSGDARWDLASVYSCTVPGRGREKV